MNSPVFLAQIGHFLFGALSVFALAVFAGLRAWLVGLCLLTIWALVKEFWYDLKYELPKQTLADSLLDFVFYEAGGGVGIALAALAHDLGRIA